MKAGAAGPRRTVGRAPHHQGPGRVGGQPAALLALRPGNADALDTIETALFCVCLEDFAPADDRAGLRPPAARRQRQPVVRQGALLRSSSPTARPASTCEHCGLDGTTILSFVDDLLGSPAAGAVAHGPGRGPRARRPSAPVEFVLDDDLRADVAAAAAAFADYAADTATTTLVVRRLRRRRGPSSCGCRRTRSCRWPTSSRTSGPRGSSAPPTSRSPPAQYRHGRTEAMRVVTPEVLAFVAAMDDPAADAATRRAAFRAAAEAHVAAGEGVPGRAGPRAAPVGAAADPEAARRRAGRHRAARAVRHARAGSIMRDDYLSTSSAPSTNIQYFGFGSTSSHCIGVAYVLLPDRFNVYLSTPAPVAAQMHAFADRLREAVSELKELLAKD